MQTIKPSQAKTDKPNKTEWRWSRVCLSVVTIMILFSPLMQVAAAASAPHEASPAHISASHIVVTGACLNNSAAQTNLSLTMHNIFLVMAGIGGSLVVIALVFWGITHSTSSVFEESSAEQKMKRRKQLFDIIIGGIVILGAATIWGVIAGTVVGAPC
jgi:uncharacterized membrane protein